MDRWRPSPYTFVVEAVGAQPTTQQKEGLELVGAMAMAKIKSFGKKKMTPEEAKLAKKRGISIRSGHGTGKDTFMSWVYLWLLVCFPKARGLVTAPTSHQLRDILWSEINKWIKFSAQDGPSLISDNVTWQTERVFLKDAKAASFITARTANVKGSAEEQGEALAGMHEDYMILGVDEASGVPRGVFAPLEGAMTGKMNFSIIIGNPTRNSGYFYDTHNTDRDRWACLHWNSENSERVTEDFCISMKEKYGYDSNMYRIRVLGEFPQAEPDSLIPLEWIQNAVNRELMVDEDVKCVLSIDPARYGDDSTAIMTRRLGVVDPITYIDKNDTMEIAGRVATLIADMEPAKCFVDSIGIGAGVVDRLKELGHSITPVNVAERAPSDMKFKRLRDELWWRVREKFETGTISIPDDDRLIGELSSIKFKYESDGRIKVEGKADMKKRGLRSPDGADALCISYFFNDKSYYKETPLDKYRRAMDAERERPRGYMAA